MRSVHGRVRPRLPRLPRFCGWSTAPRCAARMAFATTSAAAANSQLRLRSDVPKALQLHRRSNGGDGAHWRPGPLLHSFQSAMLPVQGLLPLGRRALPRPRLSAQDTACRLRSGNGVNGQCRLYTLSATEACVRARGRRVCEVACRLGDPSSPCGWMLRLHACLPPASCPHGRTWCPSGYGDFFLVTVCPWFVAEPGPRSVAGALDVRDLYVV